MKDIKIKKKPHKRLEIEFNEEALVGVKNEKLKIVQKHYESASPIGVKLDIDKLN